MKTFVSIWLLMALSLWAQTVRVENLFGGVPGAAGVYKDQGNETWTKEGYTLVWGNPSWLLGKNGNEEIPAVILESAPGGDSSSPVTATWTKYKITAISSPTMLEDGGGPGPSVETPAILDPVDPGVPAKPENYVGTFAQSLTDNQKAQARTNLNLLENEEHYNERNAIKSLSDRIDELEKLTRQTTPQLPKARAIYEAGDISGFADAAEVTAWRDLSGNGNHATATGGTAPTYDLDDGNGLAALNFDGTEFMTIGGNLKLNDNLTVFVVYSRANATSFIHQTLLGQRDLTGSLALQSYATTTDAIVSDGGTGTVPAGRFVYRGQNAAVVNNQIQLTTYRRNGAASQMGKSNCLPLNGTGIAPITIATSAYGPIDIGRRGPTSGEFLTGKIYAIHIYNALSDDEVGVVQRYLGVKYQSHLGESMYAEWLKTYSLGFGSGWLVQAITRGNDGIYYVSFNKILGGGDAYVRKYRRETDGTFVLLSEHNFTADLPTHPTATNASQLNGLDFRDGYLYAGVNNYDSGASLPQADGLGWILKIRASDMKVVFTSEPQDGLTEGGAWKQTKDGWRFFMINHDDTVHHELDEDLTYVRSHTAPTQSHPNNYLYYQSCMWMGDYAIKPNHNGGSEGLIDVHKWDDVTETFLAAQRMDAPLVSPGVKVSMSGQGMCWDREPGTFPFVGGKALLVRRVNDGEVLECYLGLRKTTVNTLSN